MTLAKQIRLYSFSRILGAVVLLAAGTATSTAQSIIPTQMLRVKQVHKPETTGSRAWTIEVTNTSQNEITAYGLAITCHYPGGGTTQTGEALDLVPLLAGNAGIVAMAEYLRSTKPELNLTINRGEDPSFVPGATRGETYFPPNDSSGVAPDAITATPSLIIVDDGRAAGDPDMIAGIFSERNDELKKRTLLIEDLHAIQASRNPAGAFEERLRALGTTRLPQVQTPKLVPGQMSILIDEPESRRNWQQEQLSRLKGQFNSMDRDGFKAAVLQFEAEAAVYTRLSTYAIQ